MELGCVRSRTGLRLAARGHWWRCETVSTCPSRRGGFARISSRQAIDNIEPCWLPSDRCLLLAFIYPIATIFVIWVISGHVGPAESALGLRPGVPGWARGIGPILVVGFLALTKGG